MGARVVGRGGALAGAAQGGGKGGAGDAGIEERVWYIEHGSLDNIDLVAVVANEFG